MLDPLYNAFGDVLAFFYTIIPNEGMEIILLTITVMLVLFPLTAKSARSMLAMQRLQPEIKKLQAKHKGDRQKLNEEMMKLYQENKVNPLGGCLPLVVQFPVFISLFHVLRSTAATVPLGSQLYKDILAAKPQMQMITKVLPIAFGAFSLFFPAGLVLYFLVSNLWRLGQQELIMRKIAPRDHVRKGGAIDAKSSPAKREVTAAPDEPEEAVEPSEAPERPKAAPRAKQPAAKQPAARQGGSARNSQSRRRRSSSKKKRKR